MNTPVNVRTARLQRLVKAAVLTSVTLPVKVGSRMNGLARAVRLYAEADERRAGLAALGVLSAYVEESQAELTGAGMLAIQRCIKSIEDVAW